MPKTKHQASTVDSRLFSKFNFTANVYCETVRSKSPDKNRKLTQGVE